MSTHSYTRLWKHLIWETLNRELMRKSTRIFVKRYGLEWRSERGGRVLTEIWSAAATRTFVYAGSTVIALQGRSYGWESISWEHKDPSGASVRYWADYGKELDPIGADAGLWAQTEIPDEGALLPYGSSYSPANPNVAYSANGIRVHVDDFMNFAGVQLTDTLGLLENAARTSANPVGYHVWGVSHGLEYDIFYDADWNRLSLEFGEFDPEGWGSRKVQFRAIYDSSWSELARFLTAQRGVGRVPQSTARVPQETAMDIARRKNCATPNSIVEQFNTQFEAHWNRTMQRGRKTVR